MSKKVSVGQCMAEILCNDTIPNLMGDDIIYSAMGKHWNKLSFGFRTELMDGLKTYLIEQLGEDMVED